MLCPRPDQSRCVENCKINAIINRRKSVVKFLQLGFVRYLRSIEVCPVKRGIIWKRFIKEMQKKHTEPKVYQYCKSKDPFQNIYYRERFN